MPIKTTKNVAERKPKAPRAKRNVPCEPCESCESVHEPCEVVPEIVPEESPVVPEESAVVPEEMMFELSPEEYLEEPCCKVVKEKPLRNEAGCYLNPLTNRYVKENTANFKKLVKEGHIVL